MLKRTEPRWLSTRLQLSLGVWVCVLGALLFWGSSAQAASMSLQPSSSTFTVGSTFDVSLMLNTEGQEINALQVSLLYPADLVQVVSPEVSGRSVIQVWTAQPRYNNESGTLELVGGIPGGLRTERGLIATLRFRVRSVGTAVIRFGDQSQVLLNDGRGTDVLTNQSGALYELKLPPPAGPLVVSETHSDQTQWYANTNVVLRWEVPDEILGFSYLLSRDPTDVPDDTSEGTRTSVAYRDLADGVHYFHVKALRDIGWGGTTHFAVKIDKSPPAEFEIEFDPGARTVRRQPLIRFATTDAASGVSHYELKFIRLDPSAEEASGSQGSEPLFIEVSSPYLPSELAIGSYDVIVRVHDKAGNYSDTTSRLKIVRQIFRLVGEDGLEIRHNFTLTWSLLWILAIVLLFGLGYAVFRLRHWHHRVEQQRLQRALPGNLQQQLSELKSYRQRYGKLSVVLLLVLCGGLVVGGAARAQQNVVPAPPIIDSVSRYLTNQEIFYLGGYTEAEGSQVTLYLQSVQTGETTSYSIQTDERGNWFYRHHTFLSTGTYLVWVQSRLGELVSPPSSQAQVVVEAAALQLGVSRLSYEFIYLSLLIAFALATLLLVTFAVFHARQARQKHGALMKEVREAEESVRRGFAVLRRDLEAELEVIKRAKLSKTLSAEEQAREHQLMKDFEEVEKYISKEIWDVDLAEQHQG